MKPTAFAQLPRELPPEFPRSAGVTCGPTGKKKLVLFVLEHMTNMYLGITYSLQRSFELMGHVAECEADQYCHIR